MSTRRAGTSILGGRATLYTPTGAKSYRVALLDPVTRTRRVLSATSRKAAEEKARAALGDWDEEAEVKRSDAPTVAQAVESWIEANSSRWVARTVEVYRYRAAALRPIAEARVTAVKPGDLRGIADGLSREQAKRLRTVVRGTFDAVEKWTGRDGRVYAEAVRIPGTASDDAPRQVERAVIPSTQWITGTIDCLYSTCQIHPARARLGETLNVVTGEHVHQGLEDLNADPWFLGESLTLGAPLSLIDSMRRGIPKHYSDPEGRRREETAELASRFRQIALITALGAAGALRIGEVLALRPRHLFGLTLDQNTARLVAMGMGNVLTREVLDGYELHGTEEMGGRLLPGYRGRVQVVEQVSPLSTGRMAISAPKMGRSREVWLSPLLYPAWDTSNRSLRQLLADTTAPSADAFSFELFAPDDVNASLWTMTERDAVQLWRAGYIPLPYLLHDRLRELWVETGGDIRKWWNCLLFPTRNAARRRGEGPLFPERWPYAKEAPNGAFQPPSNLSYRYISPVYDYVSEVLDQWPGYKGNPQRHNTDKPPRRGFTHHALRHWAISQWLGRGTPVSMVTRQAGHKDEAFTLSRYSWALAEHLPERGFEP